MLDTMREVVLLRARTSATPVVRSATAVLVVVALALTGAATVAAPSYGDTITGTSGELVPVTPLRVLGTSSAPVSLAANTWQSVQVASPLGLPASAISAVSINVSAPLAQSALGYISLSPDLSTHPAFSALQYGSVPWAGPVNNAAVVAVASDGAIAVESSTAVSVTIDVQGYYTLGPGNGVAPGGYQPVTPVKVIDTLAGTNIAKNPVAMGTDFTVSIPSGAGVPALASSVFVNITTTSYLRTAAPASITSIRTVRPDPLRPR